MQELKCCLWLAIRINCEIIRVIKHTSVYNRKENIIEPKRNCAMYLLYESKAKLIESLSN